MVTQSDFAIELEKLRIQVDQLKISFERYFLGLDRVPPLKKYDELKAAVRKHRAKNPPRNTALRFKLNSIISKFASYSRYWDRILREMEEGRMSRDRYKSVKSKVNKDMLNTYSPGALKPGPGRDEAQVRGEGKPVPAKAQSAEQEVETARSTMPSTPRVPQVDKAKLHKAYNELMLARQKTGQASKGLSYDKVMKQFEHKLPEFMKKHKCRDVELKVVVQDGKARIRAIPKK
ncbi:MAG: hypothetical protein GXP49_17715 [Deltaproteobacteria bacterium]|nr:hypothetical protein [Deltaproteobacteria bacterium]